MEGQEQKVVCKYGGIPKAICRYLIFLHVCSVFGCRSLTGRAFAGTTGESETLFEAQDEATHLGFQHHGIDTSSSQIPSCLLIC